MGAKGKNLVGLQMPLAEIAKEADVSIGTVSRVFNNSPLVKAQTKDRVLEVARELGFSPRVGVRSKRIALITEPPWKTTMGGYVSTMTQHICFALSEARASISLITENRLEELSESWFDGIIGIAWEESTVEALKKLKNVPVVWFNEEMAPFFHTVHLDAKATGRLAGRYLLEKGHRKIAVIHDADSMGGKRAEGVGEAMKEAGLAPAEALLKFPNTAPVNATVKRLLDAACDAVWVTGEDMKAIEVGWMIQEFAGRSIPGDISLLGFENPGVSEFQRPALTTIASPLREMAEKAVEVVLRAPKGKRESHELKVSLIERDSVATRTAK